MPPDYLMDNPHRRKEPKVKLFYECRIAQIEQTRAFLDAKEIDFHEDEIPAFSFGCCS